MKALCCWIAMICICTASTGCRKTAESWNQKAHKAFVAGRRDEAISYCIKALELEPGNVLAHFSLGWIYKLEGRGEEAVAEFKKALAIAPNMGGAHRHLGDIYLEKGMLDEAIAEFRKAIISQPESALTHYSLGIAYKRKGELALAADSLFEAGLVAIVYQEKIIASDAYTALKETGNEQLAAELQGVLTPWFDPAHEVAAQPQ